MDQVKSVGVCGIDIELMKKQAGTCCCLDFNGVIGTNLIQKLQSVYVTLVRMQYITRKTSGKLPDVIIVQPLVNALLKVTGNLNSNMVVDDSIGYEATGMAWGTWKTYMEEEAWMEHHIMMTNIDENGKLYEDPKYWCKVSLLNMVMSNNFGYFNMC